MSGMSSSPAPRYQDNQAVEVKAFVLLLSAVGLQLLNSAERVSAKQLIQVTRATF